MRREALDAAKTKLEGRKAELLKLIRSGDAGIAQIRAEREIEFGDEAQSEEEQERIAAGTYGRCARCGELIGARRLEANPYAVQCTDCAEAAAPARR